MDNKNKRNKLASEELFQLVKTHDLVFKGKDFYGFRLMQLDGRILEFYLNENLGMTLILQGEEILQYHRVLVLEEIKLLLDISDVWCIRPRHEITLDFNWNILLGQYLKDHRFIEAE